MKGLSSLLLLLLFRFKYFVSQCYLVQCEEATIREQLLQEFSHDDVCSLGGQLFTDSPEKGHRNNVKSLDKVNHFYRILQLFGP